MFIVIATHSSVIYKKVDSPLLSIIDYVVVVLFRRRECLYSVSSNIVNNEKIKDYVIDKEENGCNSRSL